MAEVPIFSELDKLYSNNSNANERYSRLEELFRKNFGEDAEIAVRAPGRVNLIGEHIDYSGYAVLPMAIEQDTIILLKRRTDSTIILSNSDIKYPQRIFEKVTKDIEINNKVHEWSNYVMSGVKGFLEHLNIENPIGFDALVDGIVPSGSGLSSSSSLVCVSTLGTAVANRIEKLYKKELADLSAHSERYIGTEGGGMDQAISFMAERGNAQMIEFEPLKGFTVHLPPKSCFVIANSLVTANKYVTASTCFNMRVVECRLASVVLAKKMGLDWSNIRKLKQVQDKANVSLLEITQLVKIHLHEAPYSLQEIAEYLGITIEEVTKRYLGQVQQNSFELFKRAYHVYSESLRVRQFKELCDKPHYDGQLWELGTLMNESHKSCSQSYDCSCPELDQLTQIARNGGAFGSRLTGAGWGGCTVSLISEDKIEQFIKFVKENYYEKVLNLKNVDSSIIFTTQPGAGAAIYCKNVQ